MLKNRLPTRSVLTRLTPILLLAGSLLQLTWLIEQNPIDLAGPIALSAYGVAESGGTLILPLIVLGMAGFLLSETGISWKQRGGTLAILVFVLSVFLGGGAYLNEHAIKPFFAIHRPCIKELAVITEGKSDLGISPEQFYSIPDTLGRSEYLRKTLRVGGPPMHECVRSHWIHETGYSFPSGHSFSSMLVGTFFMALGLGYFTDARRWACFAVVLWAVMVCFSRPTLRLHSALDVCAGAIEGIVIGLIAFLVFSRINERRVQKASQNE